MKQYSINVITWFCMATIILVVAGYYFKQPDREIVLYPNIAIDTTECIERNTPKYGKE